jgi:Flp pilus assembly protein TadG
MRWRRDARGAVLAEFMIAITPVLMMLFVFTQVSKLYTTHLLLQHAADCAVRATIVIHDPTITPGATGDDQEVTTAANVALGPWSSAFEGPVDAVISTSASPDDPYGMDRVTVTGTAVCRVPLGRLICPGSRKTMRVTAELPHQGANYKL